MDGKALAAQIQQQLPAGARLVDVTTCRSCRQAIFFVPTGKSLGGSLMPVNHTPDPNGNLRISLVAGQLLAYVTEQAELPLTPDDETRWMPHWATCPDEAQWRNR